MDRFSYLEKKFGGKIGAIKAYTAVIENAQAAGLKINFEAIKKTPNTLNAHRLIHWSEAKGQQSAVVAALFEAYFFEGRDLNNLDFLCDIAQSGGMDRALIERLLATDYDLTNIAERDANA